MRVLAISVRMSVIVIALYEVFKIVDATEGDLNRRYLLPMVYFVTSIIGDLCSMPRPGDSPTVDEKIVQSLVDIGHELSKAMVDLHYRVKRLEGGKDEGAKDDDSHQIHGDDGSGSTTDSAF
jgi:hypothetical protein